MKEFISNEDIFLNRSDLIENLPNFKFKQLENSKSVYNYGDFNEFDRNSRKSQGVTSPVRLIKFPISNKSNFDLSSDVIEMFRFRFNENESSTEHRLTPNSAFLIIRQKRYKRRKVILPRNLFYKDIDGNTTKRVKSSNYTFLSQNSIILENDFNATKRYKFFKKNKARDELTNLVLSKRILRTRRTLVLPAHLNITAITNSFDVIHSWFIPGLGLKMDAIPGRATHHTFYIDNVGFYYGQCAEICGRYHHHMPIRICALPFEHFLL
jgi:heme/copper-type cytochrome/quinol oxidase subunit 2